MGAATAIGAIFGPIGAIVGLAIDQTNKTKKEAKKEAEEKQNLINQTKAELDQKNAEEEKRLRDNYNQEQKMLHLKQTAVANEKKAEREAYKRILDSTKSPVLNISKNEIHSPTLLGGYNFLNNFKG